MFIFIFMCMLAFAGLGEAVTAPFVLALLFELPAGPQAPTVSASASDVEKTIIRRMFSFSCVH